MATLETPRFPDGIARDFIGGPRFLTDIAVNAGGFESRNRNWSQARRQWRCSHVPKTRAQTAEFIAFFSNVAGRADGFRFKDLADFEAASGEGVFTTLTATTFQMWKRYTTGARTHDRKIRKPISSTISISGGGTYSIDSTTGIVTKSAGADPTGWTGEFDVPVRLDSDHMEIALAPESSPLMFTWGDITLIELRDE